jgi:rubrerythrin
MSYPKYGTHPIFCGVKKCKWVGYETEMKTGDDGANECPICGAAGYYFMNDKEMAKHSMGIKDAKS